MHTKEAKDKIIRDLIVKNKYAYNMVETLSCTIETIKKDSKATNDDKTALVHFTTMMHGYRLVAESTEAFLNCYGVIQNDYGEFYSKIDEHCDGCKNPNNTSNNPPTQEPNEQNNPNNN